MDISISLPPKLIRFLKANVASGRYSSTSAVVRDALLLIQKIEQRRAEAVARTRLLNRLSHQEQDLARREALKEEMTQELIRKYGPLEDEPKARKNKARARKKRA